MQKQTNYLAHINSVGENYNYPNEDNNWTKLRNSYFPVDNRELWRQPVGEMNLKEMNRMASEKEIKLLKAHFIRLVHPLNSFVVPNKKYIQYQRGYRKSIDSEPELIHYVENYLKQKYPDEMQEMHDLILPIPQNYSSNTIYDIKWWDKRGNNNETILLRTSSNNEWKDIVEKRSENSELKCHQIKNNHNNDKWENKLKGWSGNPELKCHQIISLFLQNEPIKRDDLTNLLRNRTKIKDPSGSISSMMTDAGNAYGKVFVVDKGWLKIVPELDEIMRSLKW
ncbi:hypothetical protein EZS27_033711 [termite gut metagenome]|uniref:Uncharacterized protein n=1 Tax=termite gut metagenome TaxID=433724 RepID=A0A5J4Q4X6_9ZZZZ